VGYKGEAAGVSREGCAQDTAQGSQEVRQEQLQVLHRLRDGGNTVIVIEHNLDVVKTADWIIDLGPEGGHRGGQLVACGTPETVAGVKESYTGCFLAKILQPAASKKKLIA